MESSSIMNFFESLNTKKQRCVRKPIMERIVATGGPRLIQHVKKLDLMLRDKAKHNIKDIDNQLSKVLKIVAIKKSQPQRGGGTSFLSQFPSIDDFDANRISYKEIDMEKLLEKLTSNEN